jgi:2-haloacid dehalogenase
VGIEAPAPRRRARLDVNETLLDLDLFERRFSVDEAVKVHKPSQDAYRWVASELGAAPPDICLIASHVWDTIGALAAGWQAGLILRSGKAPLGPQPTYLGDDLDVIADQLIARSEGRQPPCQAS